MQVTRYHFMHLAQRFMVSFGLYCFLHMRYISNVLVLLITPCFHVQTPSEEIVSFFQLQSIVECAATLNYSMNSHNVIMS